MPIVDDHYNASLVDKIAMDKRRQGVSMPTMVTRLSLVQSVVFKPMLLHYKIHEITTLLIYTND
jgi:hypothetical protein